MFEEACIHVSARFHSSTDSGQQRTIHVPVQLVDDDRHMLAEVWLEVLEAVGVVAEQIVDVMRRALHKLFAVAGDLLLPVDRHAEQVPHSKDHGQRATDKDN
jgi:hypothetical protein